MEEDYNPSGSVTKVTRNTLGGRGIDMISVSTESKPFYPLYDGHGNMVARLVKGSTVGTFMTDAWRTYDVWGSVRSGSATGDPTKRYCANLGHQADDESDLICMRARYYEPGSGRFVSQDAAHSGLNWFGYCRNNPVSRVDASGCEDVPDGQSVDVLDNLMRFTITGGFLAVGFFAFVTAGFLLATGKIDNGMNAATATMYFLTFAYAGACTSSWKQSLVVALGAVGFDRWLAAAASSAKSAGTRINPYVIGFWMGYCMTVMWFTAMLEFDIVKVATGGQ